MLEFFTWIDNSMLATVAKAYGGVFVVVQMFHLLALALLGGCVLAADLRLLGVLLPAVPSETVARETDRWFNRALAVIVLSGIFMTGAVAMKLYYNEMFWAKMIALAVGVLFVYAVRRPLLRSAAHERLSPAALRCMALASMTTWFTVAACGRWIGFS
jgi:hypothetical protein